MDLTTATLQELRDYKQLVEQYSDEYNMISNRIAELEMTEQAEAKEMEVVSVEVAKFMESLDFEGEDPKELFINAGPEAAKASYNYVNTVIQNAVVAMKKADLQLIKELEASNAVLTEKLALLSDDNERLAQELYSKKLEIAEMNGRLANAATQLDEERDEVARLNSQVDDLRKEIAIGAVAATQVIDVRSAREKFLEERQKEENAKPIIHNIRWEDAFKKTVYLAELAETEETIRFSHLSMSGDIENPTTMKGKYRVVSQAEAETFRNVYLFSQAPQVDSIDSEQSSSVEEQLVTTHPDPTPFQENIDSAGSELAEEPSSMVGQVSREEFERLKAEFYDVKARVFGNY